MISRQQYPDKLPLQDINPFAKTHLGANAGSVKVVLRRKKFSLADHFSVLTKRDELSFFTVFAFPKDSRMGLACKSCRSSSPYHRKRNLLSPHQGQHTKLINL